jgi:hypothetical protein
MNHAKMPDSFIQLPSTLYPLQKFMKSRLPDFPGDVIVTFPTGSGKTLAYLLPLVDALQKVGPIIFHARYMAILCLECACITEAVRHHSTSYAGSR